MKTRHLKQKTFIFIGVVLSVFIIGLFFGFNSWNKNIYVSWNPSESRGLATGTSKKILSLSSDYLTQKASQILLSQTQVIRENGFIDFYLGNFLTVDKQLKTHRFVCEIFPLVELIFKSAGVNFSGDAGLMVLQTPCLMKNENLIGPFQVPYDNILSHPKQTAFELPNKKIFISFYNASILLTDAWLLTSIRFFKTDLQDDELLIRFTIEENKPYFELKLKEASAQPIERTNIEKQQN